VDQSFAMLSPVCGFIYYAPRSSLANRSINPTGRYQPPFEIGAFGSQGLCPLFIRNAQWWTDGGWL